MPTSTAKVLFVRVSGQLKQQIARDAKHHGEAEAVVVRRILKAHYTKEGTDNGK